MSSIRDYFAPKGGQGAVPKAKAPAPKSAPSKPTKGRGKRKVLSDSEDDEDLPPPKKLPTPQKAQPNQNASHKSPAGEVTTTSDYFASSKKKMPTRSTPTKKKQQETERDLKVTPAKPTPKPKPTPKSAPSTNGRTSVRTKKKPNYADANSDEGSEYDGKAGSDGEDSGEDVYEAKYKSSRKGAKDDYESDDDLDDVKPISKRKSSTQSKPRQQAKKAETDEDEDVQVMEIPMEKIPLYRSPKLPNGGKKAQGANGRKRKSADLEDGDDDYDIEKAPSASKKAKASNKSPAKKATPRKATPKKKASEAKNEDVRTAVDEILDDIPTIRAPTPPPRDPSKKFDFRAAGNRAEAVSSGDFAGLPTGAENCLAGLSFVFTGVLETLQREKGQELVKQYGGKVTGNPSKKTSFVVLGNDAGPKKLETIKQYSLKTINERGLFELIKRLPANGGDSKAAEANAEKARKEQEKVEQEAAEMEKAEHLQAKEESAREKARAAARPNASPSKKRDPPGKDSRLWTVKYAPTAINMVCGNKGQVEKLQAWLRAWPMSVKKKFRHPGKDGTGAFRAMCLHGPPGIGKTTAAHLAAHLEGYDIVESNASDTRSKSLVENNLKGILDTTSLLGYFAGDGQEVESSKKKLVLIMDEVDGMSAGDRGGVGALAAVCKKTTIPIILICNDRRLPKMKPFDSVAYDLPFRRPTVQQTRARIMTICYREGLNIPPNVINALIEGSHADIRQVINMLSTAKIDYQQEGMDFEKGKQMTEAWEKHVILKPWDIVSKILGGGMFASSSTSKLNDKIELYFNDHEFSSLMLQENYLGTQPMRANSYSGREWELKRLELTDQAAESISDGDLIDRMIHGSQQQWSLMPSHAVASFVRPASFVSGTMVGHQIRFTSWLGNNSKLGKLSRFLKEIQGHMRLHSSGDCDEVRQQYFSTLWYRLVKQLELEGREAADEIIELMDSYFLTKDDWDAIVELGLGEMDAEKLSIESADKSAFTRAYNARPHPVPFMKASQVVAPKKKDKERPDLEEAIEESDSGHDTGDEQAVVEDEQPLDLKKDKYVKAPKKTASAKGSKAPTRQNTKEDVAAAEDNGDGKAGKGKGTGKGKTKAGRGRPKK